MTGCATDAEATADATQEVSSAQGSPPASSEAGHSGGAAQPAAGAEPAAGSQSGHAPDAGTHGMPSDGPSAASPCVHKDDLALPKGVALPASTACFSRMRLLDAAYPRLAEADPDTEMCPLASSLDWGPVGPACSFQPRCDMPVSTKSASASQDEDSGVAAFSECCYWVTAVCGS